MHKNYKIIIFEAVNRPKRGKNCPSKGILTQKWAELTENSLSRVWKYFSGHGNQVENECSTNESRLLLALRDRIQPAARFCLTQKLENVYSSIFSISFSIRIFLFRYSWLKCFWCFNSLTFSTITGFNWNWNKGSSDRYTAWSKLNLLQEVRRLCP